MFKKFGLSALAVVFAFLPLGGAMAATGTQTTTTNLIANPSMDTSSTGWLDGTWGTNTHTATYETTGHTAGSGSLKETVSAYTDGDSKWYFNAVAVTPGANYQYSNWYMSNIDSEIDVEVTDTTGAVTYNRIVAAPASPTTWTQAKGTFIAPANAKSVSVYQTIAGVGYVQIDDASLSTYVPAQFNRAMVSLTFDDGWLNQYTAGLPILDKYGVKSTFYAISSTITDRANNPSYMGGTEFLALQNDGMEIAAHTVTHPHLPTLTQAQIEQELSDSKTVLQNLLGTVAAQNFATPFGEYNATVLAEAQKYYRSHRSTDEGYNSKDNFDIYNIKVQNILDTTTPAQVAAWVAQAQADKTWLVLVYHLVGTDPAAGTEDYSVTPANLDAEIAAMKASGITIETVNAALDEIQAQAGTTTPPVVTTKPGDINGDKVVDALDLSTLLTNWNKTAATAAMGDTNADGVVDALDLSTLLTNWSK